ncbi:MAG TPA: ATP-binding protein [Verrucomicrobiae bacterium]|jgi:two-component system phosphate regulon sensor histidine kinase PhoR
MWAGLIIALAAVGTAWFFWKSRRLVQAELEQARRQLESSREQQQRDLAHTQAQQQALFDSMIEGVLLLDPKGNIRLVNQALERLFGVTFDLRGKTVMEAFRLHELQALINAVLVEGRVVAHELELPSLDGRCLQVNAASILGRESRLQGIILVFHDLTRLKRLENTRQEFVANVSHELRTPLSMIKGYAETLIEGAKDDPEVALRFLQTIDKHADRLTYLIEDLLTISRLESGQIAINLEKTELRPVIERALVELRGRGREKTVTLLNEVPEGLIVRVDADRIHQVVFNLVDNAIKYGRREVCVAVGAHVTSEKFVEVSVNDNGPGIAAEHLGRIFERFYRADKARSREHGGTGLGLSIVKHIVQSHGGEVWAKSEVERGATFYFTLLQP